MKEKFSNFIKPEESRDAYQIAEERSITPAEAADQMKREGWQPAGYDIECGTQIYIPPKK